ncbi:hypothetical protein PINS_up008689 [Pythium insidiosum]|nr:hypothetical protein PINS_up008689 [Pythium insidiosum]
MQSSSLQLERAVAHAQTLVASLRDGEGSSAELQAMAATTHGRCVLGLAGYLELAHEQLQAFAKQLTPSDADVERMHEVCQTIAVLSCVAGLSAHSSP